MEELQEGPVSGIAMSYDCAVTGVDYVINRTPNPAWGIKDFVNSRSHILAYCVSGKAYYRVNGTSHRVVSGTLIFLPAGMPHTGRSDRDDPWHFVSAAFQLAALDEESANLLKDLPPITHNVPAEVGSLFYQMRVAWEAKQPGHQLQIRGLLSLVLSRAVEEYTRPALSAPHARRVATVTAHLLENYHSVYSVEELAQMSGLSPSHFRVVFKKVTGMTATNYQQHIRITKATEFLSSGEHNVTETARLLGFRDVYYFSRLYKRVTGINPSRLAKG
ncbi:AraC family transcriptional regulator [Paenarthrobacter sp. OM7]|uniref:AraC family transcriptional regulator n=1 Tax=Paenarthrobacter sp. AMU7 TaxID=3162492 RepID=A0AB39YQU2_9MICC|nr:AraC family transcriptional regulator [Paenarthrobacter sp. OM7]WGM20264.1 AraC family transcriptional regulator [Paenarthrobacter sp. OM7]